MAVMRKCKADRLWGMGQGRVMCVISDGYRGCVWRREEAGSGAGSEFRVVPRACASHKHATRRAPRDAGNVTGLGAVVRLAMHVLDTLGSWTPPSTPPRTSRPSSRNLMGYRSMGLRDKVAAVWNEALTSGCGGKGWTFDEIRAIPFTLLAGKIDLRFVEHLNSCCKQCIAISGVLKEVFGSRIPVNLDYLIAGSLLADVGKMLEFDKKPAADGSTQVVKGFGDMLRHPFLRRRAVLQARHPRRGDAHRRDAQPRRRQGGSHHRVLDLPPRGLHRLRYREGAGEGGEVRARRLVCSMAGECLSSRSRTRIAARRRTPGRWIRGRESDNDIAGRAIVA